jgi:GTP-binding protein
MRREGFEFSIGKPKVVIKEEEGQKLEPYERTHIEVPEAFSGPVIEELSKRKGEMKNLFKNEHNITSIEFLIPTRSLMGYRNEFMNVTKGKGILTSIFDHFGPYKGDLPGRKYGAFISNAQEKSTTYAIFNLQERGVIFIGPGVDVYEGMIIGRNSRDNDLVVNITREKHLTNVRASGSDENLILTPPEQMDLEKAMQFIEDDEKIEVTPHFIRIRKNILKETDRKRNRSNA